METLGKCKWGVPGGDGCTDCGACKSVQKATHVPPLVALYSSCGGCGKSEVARHLFTDGYRPIKFAEPLKEMLRTLLIISGVATMNTVDDYIEGALKEEIIPLFGKSPRDMMRTLGTEWGRDCVSKTMWVDIVQNRINAAHEAEVPVVIDDMRFENEYELLEGHGALLVKVVRPGMQAKGDHQSDGALDGLPFDVVLHNDGTLEDLYAKVTKLLYG